MRREWKIGFAFALVCLAPLFLSTAGESAQSATTLRGTIVGVTPDGDALVVRVPSSVGPPIERTIYVNELTRIRNAGEPVALESLPPGGRVVVVYSRTDGRSVARIVDLSGDVLEQGPVGERIDNLEDRGRYEESTRATLETFEEEIDELARASETAGVTELARRKALTSDLRAKLADAKDGLDGLTAAGSEVAWQAARRKLQAVMSDLSDALARARSEITGR